MNLGGGEIIGLFLLALLLFGPKRLPEIGRNLGQALRELRRMSSEVTTAFTEAMDEQPTRTSSSWEEGSSEDPYASAYNVSREWDESDEDSGEAADQEAEEPEQEAEAEASDGDEPEPASDQPATDEAGEEPERNMTYGSD